MALSIIGSGGHAKVLIEIAESKNLEIREIVTDNSSILQLFGYPVVTKIGYSHAIIAIGDNAKRKKIASETNAEWHTLMHEKATISKRVSIGAGTVIMAGATINCDVKIGNHCIINTNSSVDHDCILDDYVHISPNVALAGKVTIGEGAHIGIGSSVIPGIKIGKWSTIGAGAVVITNVPDYAVVVGVPAKIIHFNEILFE